MKKKFFIFSLIAFLFASAFSASSVGANPSAVYAQDEHSKVTRSPLMDCPDCEGTGRNHGKDCMCWGDGLCDFCEGTGGCYNCYFTGICQGCHGEDSESCFYCGGTGRCEHCDGENICNECHGSGECQFCDPCTTCGGTGKVAREISFYTIVGDAALMGSDWDETDSKNDMTDTGSGHLKLVKENVTLSAGDYEYKMVADHEWGIRDLPADGNQVLSIEHNGTYTITFEGDTTELNASYVEVFASLDELVTKLPATNFKENVIVTITDAVIEDFFENSSGYINGIYVTAANTTVLIRYNDVPSTWEVGGKVSGTIEAEWYLWNGIPQLSKWEGGWDAFTYTPTPIEIVIDELKLAQDFGTFYAFELIDNETTFSFRFVIYYSGSFEFGKTYTFEDMDQLNSDLYLVGEMGRYAKYSACDFVATLDNDVITSIVANVTLTTGVAYHITYTASPTIADILTTVEGGFPSSSDGNAPSNAWVNSNNEKMFSCEGDLYVGGESDGDFVLTANTKLTKDGNNYKCTKDGAAVTFIMDDGALTSISIEGLTDDAKLNGTYTAPAVWPADAPTEAPAVPTHDGTSLLGAPLTTNLDFQPLDWPGSMPEKLTFETGETFYYMEKMNWQIYTNWAEDSYDMSEYDMLHVDLFPASGTQIRVEIEGLRIDDGGQGYKNYVVKTLTAGEWNSLDIALSEFPALNNGDTYDFSDVRYFILEGYNAEETALSVGNVYFYKAPHEHAIKTTHAKVEGKCEEAGHKAYYECSCGKYFSKQELTTEIEDLETWLGENGDGYIAPIGHDTDIVIGTPATEGADGFKNAYKCNNCGKYYEDADRTKLIGDEAAYNAWKLAEGKINKLDHDMVIVGGNPATYRTDGFKYAYKCNNCGKYFEDRAGTKLIGDEAAYNAWKLAEGKIPALNPQKENGLSGGAIAGIVIGSVFGLLIIAFVVLYILWKRKNLNIPLLCIVLTPAFRFINKLFFKTKLNDVEAKEAENKAMKE